MNYAKLYEKTNYPNLYKMYYWGSMQYTGLENDIIRNRNIFAAKYCPKYGKCMYTTYSFVSMLKESKYGYACDHVEMYKISGGYIVLNSIYDFHEESYISKTLEPLGFKKYINMYSTHAYTYIKFATLNQLREDIKIMSASR